MNANNEILTLDSGIIDSRIIEPPKIPQADTEIPKTPVLPQVLKRDFKLSGSTYKISPPHMASSIYVTINHNPANDRVYEIFLFSIDPKQSEHLVVMSRFITALWRREINPTFVIANLKSMQSINSYYLKGKFYRSVMFHIGCVIEEHMIQRGFIDGEGVPILEDPNYCEDCD